MHYADLRGIHFCYTRILYQADYPCKEWTLLLPNCVIVFVYYFRIHKVKNLAFFTLNKHIITFNIINKQFIISKNI